jgi:hypothetical protein
MTFALLNDHETGAGLRAPLSAWRSLGALSLLAALSLSSAGFASPQSPPIQPAPIPINTFVPDFLAETAASDAQANLELNLARSYLSVAQDFEVGVVSGFNAALYQATFGAPFVLGESGVWSVGSPGALNVGSYTVVRCVEGVTTNLSNLHVWAIDPTIHGIPMPTPPSGTTVEVFFYSAEFGATGEHVGYAVRLTRPTYSVLSFAPTASVPSGGLIDGEDAGAFLSLIANGTLNQGVSFVGWALDRYAQYPVTGGGGAVQIDGGCNLTALNQCLGGAMATYSGALSSAGSTLRSSIDAIMSNFSSNTKATLGGSIAAGVVIGAFAGPVGALVGLVGGAVGGLVATAFYADDAQDDLDAAHNTYNTEKCAAMTTAANTAKNCVASHCPAALASFTAHIDAAVAQSGC